MIYIDLLYTHLSETGNTVLCSYVQILQEEITPTLTRLKEERSSYLEYQQVIRELEHLNKLYIAYQFFKTEVRHGAFEVLYDINST